MARIYTNGRSAHPHPALARMVAQYGGMSHAATD